MNSTEKKSVLFISCGIFKDELEYLLREKKLDGEIVFLDAALHVNFDRLKEKLVGALEEYRGSTDNLKVVYGYCHPEMQEIMENYEAKKIRAGNCLEAMLGAEELKRLSSEAKTFFLSAGWINNWEKLFAQGKKDFDFDFESMFDTYQRIVVLDTGIIPLDEEKMRRFSEFTRLPIERKAITLDYFLKLVQSI
ncbi:MAG: DUF1638 domain-containing protein [Alphaproteobacteria bacterium]|uniref:DUF1638 domain-containing protein n=1 Tax=Candidatus Nitrobium versatile TaxID=2884831 RepID=A0A953M3F9_9BACT|nr:DUF1638 domain-containing protein [Candidatus Nitrobium versatile]